MRRPHRIALATFGPGPRSIATASAACAAAFSGYALHSLDRQSLKEVREPLSRAGDLLCLPQFREAVFDAPHVARDGGWDRKQAVEHGRYRGLYGRSRAR